LQKREAQIEGDYLTIFGLSFYAADSLRSVGFSMRKVGLDWAVAVRRGLTLLTRMQNAQ
jgi:hypothetical protein